MAIHKLKEAFVKHVATDGSYGDGGNLWLQVRNGGKAKSWVFRYRGRWMGLGSLDTISLANARERARQCREQILDGIDPLAARKDAAIAKQLEASKYKTVAQCADEWITAQRESWVQHTAEIIQGRITKYVKPKIGDLPVHLVDEQHVYDVVKPMWGKGKMTPTGHSVRQHLESILDFAKAKKYRKGDNPASWSGPISTLLPAMKKIHKTTHHPSLPYAEVGKFIAELRASRTNNSGQGADPITPYLIEFLILTAVRKSEMLFARWNEFDIAGRVWTVPPARAEDKSVRHSQRGTKTGDKTGEPHKIFLNPQAIRILETMKAFQDEDGTHREDGYVFVHRITKRLGTGPRGAMTGKPFAISTMKAFLHRAMGRKDITPHGFRTTFKSWSVDTSQDEIASEMALDHAVGGPVRNIYARDGQKIETRRQLMDAWGQFCDRTEPLPGHVIDLRRQRKAHA
jgi:integrase